MLDCFLHKAETKRKRSAYAKHSGQSEKTSENVSDGSFLISVNPGYETEMVEGCLRSANIPYVIKSHSGPAGFSRFDTKYESCGSDIYVPSALLYKAKKALPPEMAEQVGILFATDEEKSTNETMPENNASGNIFKQLLATILFLLVVALVVFAIDTIMNIVRVLVGFD